MTIHRGHPFDTGERDPHRQLRSRLGGAVSLWTSGADGSPAGLTVSSLMVALGEPARVLGLLDPDADLTLALEESGTAVVQLLDWAHRSLADMFAGVAPAPGGPFRQAEFVETDFGPRLADAPTWAGVRLESMQEVGWSLLATCVIEEIQIGRDEQPLIARRGRWVRPPAGEANA